MIAAPHSTPGLVVDIEPDRDWVCLALVGELDLATVPTLAGAVSELREAGFRRFRLDLRRLQFIDSTGLRALLELSRDDGLELSIQSGPPAVQRALEVSGIGALLPMRPERLRARRTRLSSEGPAPA